MQLDQLKEQARRHEQSEQWAKALDFYLQAIQITEESEEPDISLFNRVGDLQVRVGDVDGAVATYERAISLYMDADLPNNAIAICQKIIRNVPGRAKTFLEMGQIRARQGFLVDARQNFLTYAEMRQTRGDTEGAFRALTEFVHLVPGDVDTRLFLAEQLAGREKLEEALTHFEMAYRHLLKDGEEDRARTVQSRVAELAPDATLSSELPPDEAQEPVQGGLVGFETTSMDSEIGLDGEDRIGSPEPAVEEEAEIETGDLAFSDIGGGLPDGDDEEESAVEEASEALEAAHEEAFGELDLSGMEEEGEVEEETTEAPAPLPTLDEETEAADPFDWEGEDQPDSEAGTETASEPDESEGLEGFELEDLEGPEPAGEQAWGEDPDDRSARDEVFDKPAGEAIEEGFEAAERVAEPDEEFSPAETAPPDEDTTPDQPGEGGGEYVDLGSMVIEEKGEGTTRWKVESDAPSGDEQADFAKMLSQFKEKVAQNLDTGDFTARYDLGAAYKDMGLMDEAITEFQAALRADPRSLAAMEMLGQCFLEKGEHQAAIRTLQRALAVPNDVEDDFLGIYYYLGQCYEATADTKQALEVYEKVFSLDINFRDVTERLRALR